MLGAHAAGHAVPELRERQELASVGRGRRGLVGVTLVLIVLSALWLRDHMAAAPEKGSRERRLRYMFFLP